MSIKAHGHKKTKPKKTRDEGRRTRDEGRKPKEKDAVATKRKAEGKIKPEVATPRPKVKKEVPVKPKEVKVGVKPEVKPAVKPKEEKIAVKPIEEKKPEVKIAVKPVMAEKLIEKPVEKPAVKPKEEEKPKEVAKEVIPEIKQPRLIEAEFPLTVKQFADKLNIRASDIISLLMKKGFLATMNQNLPDELVIEIAKTYSYEIKKAPTVEDELLKEHKEAEHREGKRAPTVIRAPIVTFMGHVDHGKTSLLDYIRKTKIAAKEKGGITQHIGAYSVDMGQKGRVTFLDTPGHEAFTAMRARGANATDIVVLVVAADDGVMPQTVEAIDHAKQASVTIVVAINKCDLPNINTDKVKKQLSEYGLMPEEWSGKTIMVPVSAKTGSGVDKLLEMLLLEAEIMELKASPELRARGVVVEGKLSPEQGPVATVLVRNGTLRLGDVVWSGLYYGRVKAMINDRGKRITEALPSTPVEILGLSGVPEAGNEFFVVKDEKKARTLSQLKQQDKRLKKLGPAQRISLEELYKHIKDGTVKELKVIVKGDVQGSIEALKKSLNELSTSEVKLNAIHVACGNINESDIMLALVSNAIVIGFNVKVEPKAEEIAKKELVDIKIYDIIYEAVQDVKAALEGLLEPIVKEVFVGRAQVRQVFNVSKIGNVAGCYVVKGTIPRTGIVKLVRNKEVIFTGKIRSLKHLKDDIKEARENLECGISLEGHGDVKAGDLIESYKIEKITRRLEG